MIKLFIAFMLGAFIGLIITALAVAAGDADRCAECMRLTEHNRGQWTDSHGGEVIGNFSGYCSKCGNWSEYLTDYCGHCGAKMEGEK